MGSVEHVLEVRGIVKVYGGVRALQGVSLSLAPGEVHCLAGENGSGKSTLIKIISGVERADSGEIVIDGQSEGHVTPAEAIHAGVQVIYQDFSLFPNLSAAENIGMLNELAGRRKVFSRPRVRLASEKVVSELELELDLDAKVGDLSVADRQLVAICRALVGDVRILIMDEPTTALTTEEVARLFAVVRKLQDHGVAVMFVSHKLEEVLKIAQRVTVLRNGRVVETGDAEDFTAQSIAQAMTGHEIHQERIVSTLEPSDHPLLRVEGFGLAGAFKDVSFSLDRGELLGITGLLGSGRSEIAEAIFGVRPVDTGTIEIEGKRYRIRSIEDAVRAGIGYVPEDRLSQGLFLEKSVADNIIAPSLDRYRNKARLLDRGRIARSTAELLAHLRIKAASPQAPARSLSGGNAQRVVIAKWLDRHPRVLILNGPTVGVDIGSKEEIFSILREQADRGIGVIVISDDLPELVASCHRVLIVKAGRVVSEVAGDEISVDRIQERMAS